MHNRHHCQSINKSTRLKLSGKSFRHHVLKKLYRKLNEWFVKIIPISAYNRKTESVVVIMNKSVSFSYYLYEVTTQIDYK